MEDQGWPAKDTVLDNLLRGLQPTSFKDKKPEHWRVNRNKQGLSSLGILHMGYHVLSSFEPGTCLWLGKSSGRKPDMDTDLLSSAASKMRVPVSLPSTVPVAGAQPVRHDGKLLCGHGVSCCCIVGVLSVRPHGAFRAVIMQLLQQLITELPSLIRVPFAPQLLRPSSETSSALSAV